MQHPYGVRAPLTFADLAAGVRHREGRGAQQLRAGHQAAVNLAFLGDRSKKKKCIVSITEVQTGLNGPNIGVAALQIADPAGIINTPKSHPQIS